MPRAESAAEARNLRARVRESDTRLHFALAVLRRTSLPFLDAAGRERLASMIESQPVGDLEWRLLIAHAAEENRTFLEAELIQQRLSRRQ